MRRTMILIATGFMSLASAAAELPEWLKQTDADSLGLFVRVDKDCPVSKETVEERVEGEFLRARLKPTNSLLLNLNVDLLCLKATAQNGSTLGFAVALDVNFSTMTSPGVYVLYMTPDHGSLLMVSDESDSYLLGVVRDRVADALTDYLKANAK